MKGPVHTQAAQVGARRIGGESLGAWGMPPRLLALAVLGLISLDAAASLAHGEPVQGQIPFRYARPTGTEAGGTPERERAQRRVRCATPWRTRMREGWGGCAV